MSGSSVLQMIPLAVWIDPTLRLFGEKQTPFILETIKSMKLDRERRVVITGLGPVSPVGIGNQEFWDAVVHSKSNYREVTRFPIKPHYKTRIAAELDVYVPQIDNGKLVHPPQGFKGLNVGKYVNQKTLRKIQSFSVPFGDFLFTMALQPPS